MWQGLKNILKYVRPHWKWALVAVSMAFPLAALRSAPPPLFKYLFDEVLTSEDAQKLALIPALVVGLYTLNFFVRFFHTYSLRMVGALVGRTLRFRLFSHLLHLSPDFFVRKSTGHLTSRVTIDPIHVDAGIAAMNTLAREPITFVALLGYAFYLNWKMTMLVAVLIPVLGWLFDRINKLLRNYFRQVQEETARYSELVQQGLSGFQVIKTFGLEPYIRKRAKKRLDEYLRIFKKTIRLEEASHPTVEWITAGSVALVIWFGGNEVIVGTMSIGEFSAFFFSFGLMLEPLKRMNDVNIKLSLASAAIDRIEEVLSWKSTLDETQDTLELVELKEGIRFENVRFSYPNEPDREILRGLSFDLPKGKSLALVGPSGAGKSSLVSLLPRLYDIDDGQILIDGRSILKYSTTSLRKSIAVVSQDVFLFNDTVRENIRCGRLDATDSEIEDAIEKAHASDFIRDLPQGLDTPLGDRGLRLSGGERQRIAIARAFLRQAPILILDEATSSLDNASEKAVQKALDELMVDRTSLIIAHRLSTIRHVDQIVVLQAGKIVERGNHQALISSDGVYSKLHQLGETEQRLP